MELAKQRERFEWLVALNSSHNGILIVDANGIVRLYNQAAHRIFHYDRPGPVGKHMSEVRPEAWPDIKRILSTGEPQVGVRIELAPGHRHRQPQTRSGKTVKSPG